MRLVDFGQAKTRAMPVLAGLALGIGGVAAGASLVQASERGGVFDFFEAIFRGPVVRPAEPAATVQRPARPRYASLPDARRIAATQPLRQTPRQERSSRSARTPSGRSAAASAALTASMLGTRTVCVRACDGYLFPLGQLAARTDIPVHEAACAAACPNAQTHLYTLASGQGGLDRAVGLDGRPYRALPVANLYRTKRVEQCSCQPEGVAATPLPIERDLTARVGDVVATPSSARVVVSTRRDGFTVVDFREARILTARQRRSIDRKIDVVRREADARAAGLEVRQVARTPERVPRIRVAQIGGFGVVEPRPEAEPGFSVVRVVVPSPFPR